MLKEIYCTVLYISAEALSIAVVTTIMVVNYLPLLITVKTDKHSLEICRSTHLSRLVTFLGEDKVFILC